MKRSKQVRLRSHATRRSLLAEIKTEVVRIGASGSRQGFKFAERAMKALPELRNA